MNKLPHGWSLEIREEATETLLIIEGPGGAGASWGCPRSEARALVLRYLMNDSGLDTEAK